MIASHVENICQPNSDTMTDIPSQTRAFALPNNPKHASTSQYEKPVDKKKSFASKTLAKPKTI